MSIQIILLPLFLQVALTFVLLFWMARVRTVVIRSGEVKIKDIALGQSNWPPKATQIANCYNSQLQVPLLFYVLTVLEIVTHHADLLFVAMAWLFVISRLLHAYIHTGSNYVPYRFMVFAAGVFILLAMWAIYAVRMLTGLP